MTIPQLIAPSILSADFAILGNQIQQAEAVGADWVHIDVMDGHFVPNISIGPLVVEACKRASSLPLDVHLMIEEPDRYLRVFAEAGADNISVHVEASPNIDQTLKSVKKLGCQAGVALKPNTDFKAIEDVVGMADIVLVMSVEPGFGGQQFMESVLPKVEKIRNAIATQSQQTLIEIDGGIDENTISLARKAGVNVFVSGSAIFGNEKGIAAGILTLKKSLA